MKKDFANAFVALTLGIVVFATPYLWAKLLIAACSVLHCVSMCIWQREPEAEADE